MSAILRLEVEALDETLRHLQLEGRRGLECLVLWLGRRNSDGWSVEEVHRPAQVARFDQFTIPPAAMQALQEHLKMHRRMIVAQVHTHPGRAFHSPADDTGAIVRHVGALSLVLPNFALSTSAAEFVNHAELYRLSAANRWEHAPNVEAVLCLNN